jgi:integrase
MTTAIILAETTAIETMPQLQTALDVLLYSLSAASKRQYEHTFAAWAAYAREQGFQPFDLSPLNIIGFLGSVELAHKTKTARLSHLRKLLQTLHAQQPDNVQLEAMYKQVQLLKVKRDNEAPGNEREKHALKPKQIHAALAYWNGATKLHIRNRALLAVLFYAGLRRSEAAALEWRDIDLENGIITVRHGKGDKERNVPILSDTLKDYLAEWDSITDGRKYVFCAMRKGDHLDTDKPMKTNAIWTLIKDTGAAIGVNNLAPHDARRTLLTNALQSGANVADAQFIAGHANPQTTLGYAVVKDAKEVAGRVKLNY